MRLVIRSVFTWLKIHNVYIIFPFLRYLTNRILFLFQTFTLATWSKVGSKLLHFISSSAFILSVSLCAITNLFSLSFDRRTKSPQGFYNFLFLQFIKVFPSPFGKFSETTLRLVSLNELLSTLDKNVSNSGEVVFGALQFDFFEVVN